VESHKLLAAKISSVYRATKHNVVSTYRACQFGVSAEFWIRIGRTK